MTALDLIAGIGLAAWLYLLFFNGGFWLSGEREEAEQNNYRRQRSGLASRQSSPHATKPICSRAR